MTAVAGPPRLPAVDEVRSHQRQWLEEARQQAQAGQPFVICTSDEFEEVLNALGIPVLVINYWNYLIAAKRKGPHYTDLLERHGYPGPHFFAFGLAATWDPTEAPWGGLPRPLMVLGSTRHDYELRVTEKWADALGCPCYPLDFNFSSPYKQVPPEDWWVTIRDRWEDLVDADRLALRTEQNRTLLGHLEALTGRTLSVAALTETMTRVNQQMDVMTEAAQINADARPCPVTMRDQLSAYQMMWHRGTEAGLRLAETYRDDVRRRAEAGEGGYASERVRLLYWSMDREPAFHTYLQEAHGAVIVGTPYAAVPAAYARELHGDPLRALSARHLFLFDMRSPSWMLAEVERHGVDGVIGVEDDADHPSVFERACESAGVPYVGVPHVGDDEELRGRLDRFIDRIRT